MVHAHRALLKAALEDPLNGQFQLLCDTSVPLRQPIFIYEQLVSHRASRIAHLSKVSILHA